MDERVTTTSAGLRKIRAVVALALTALFAISCSEPIDILEQAPIHEVDPVFREYYLFLGGEERLGKAISAVNNEGDLTAQYLETCKMVYDPNALVTQRFRLAPLGKQMGLIEPPSAPPQQPEIRYLNGHSIHPDFLHTYETLGANHIGRPLTEARFNIITKRYEQFFENLGLYRVEGLDEVQLLPYGVWACSDKCSPGEPSRDTIIDAYHRVDPTFQEYAEQIGADLTGFAITNGYVGKDGKWEQIFENAVLVAESTNSTQSAALRLVSKDLNILAEAPKPYSGDPERFFYTVEGNQGYEVPAYFWDYLVYHGGVEVFGPPISHYSPMGDQLSHQCFAKLCLSYDEGALSGARVQPEPLGYAYRVLYYSEGEPKLTPAPEIEAPIFIEPTATSELGVGGPGVDQGREIFLQVWESYPVINSEQFQEIGITVLNRDQPLADLLPELLIDMPGGSQQPYSMEPTGTNGQSLVVIPPVSAPNGTLVAYKVCVRISDTDKFCGKESFLIWNNP